MNAIALLIVFASATDIPMPNVGPFGAAISPDGSRVLVAEFGSFSPYVIGDTVAVIDTGTNTVIGTITVGMQPEDIAFSPNGSHAFVVNAGSSSVSVIHMDTLSVIATVPVGDPFATYPFGISVSPDGSRAYVNATGGNWDGSEENIFVLDADPSSGTFAGVIDTIEITGGFTRGAFRQDNHTYVVARGFADNDFSAPPRVTQIRNGEVVGETIVVPAVGGFHGAEDLAVTPNGRYAYLPVFNFTDGTDEVFVVDLRDNSLTDIIRLGSNDTAQHGITIDPSGLLVVVTNFYVGSVSVIFTPTNTVIYTIGVGDLPNEVVFTPDGLRAYVTNQGSNSVSVIDFAPRHELVIALAQDATVAPNAQNPLIARISAVQNNSAALPSLVNFIRVQSERGNIQLGAVKDLNPPAEDLNDVDVRTGGVDAGTATATP